MVSLSRALDLLEYLSYSHVAISKEMQSDLEKQFSDGWDTANKLLYGFIVLLIFLYIITWPKLLHTLKLRA